MLDHLLRQSPATGTLGRSTFWAHWRGRHGASEEEQARFWATVDPSRPSSISPADTPVSAEPTTAKDPVNLVFRTWEGEKRIVPAYHGETLLQVARREDLPSMEGTCGGNLGTSHFTLKSMEA